jgi:hypothetical protein
MTRFDSAPRLPQNCQKVKRKNQIKKPARWGQVVNYQYFLKTADLIHFVAIGAK